MANKTRTQSLRLHIPTRSVDGLVDEAQHAHVSIETFAEQILEAVIPNEDRFDDLTNGGNKLARLAREYPRMSFVQLLQAALMDYTDRAVEYGIDAHGFILEPAENDKDVKRPTTIQ
jgi:hypothetical protein